MIFLVICDLIIPLTMIALGILYQNHYPKEINRSHGYRTARSMKNQDTWTFSQKVFGKVALKKGTIILPISIVEIFLTVSQGKDRFAWISLVLIFVQIAMMFSIVWSVENKLKKYFDENGIRKSQV